MASTWEDGVRYFDTAPAYGNGLSELRFGQALEGRPSTSAIHTSARWPGRSARPVPSGHSGLSGHGSHRGGPTRRLVVLGRFQAGHGEDSDQRAAHADRHRAARRRVLRR